MVLSQEKSNLKSVMHGDGFDDYLSEVIRLELIDRSDAEGIAKLVLNRGIDSLTENQLHIFLDHALGKVNYISNCNFCSNPIPWSEMLEAVWTYEDNYCGHCRNLLSKVRQE